MYARDATKCSLRASSLWRDVTLCCCIEVSLRFALRFWKDFGQGKTLLSERLESELVAVLQKQY